VSVELLPAMADPALLRATPGIRAADLARAQTSLAKPPTGQIAIQQCELAVTVENPTGESNATRGMVVAERLGPFVDPNGFTHIVNLLPVTASHPVAFGTAAPFGVFPVSGSPTSATTLTLGPGSVWFATNLLVPGVPAGSFSGFRISGGTLGVEAVVTPVPMTLQNGTYIASDATVLRLAVTLSPPAPGTGTQGEDLTDAVIGLPASITMIFTPTNAAIDALGDASLTLYGTALTLTRKLVAPVAILADTAILIPFTPPPPPTDFKFRTVASAWFQPAGTAPIDQAGWSLPVAQTSIGALGEASGAGSLTLGLGPGAKLRCTLRAGVAAISGWMITIDPTALRVVAGGTGPADVTAYTLWPSATPGDVKATVDWANPASFSASLLATPGDEIVATSGLASAFLDRPLAADGGALPMAGAGTLLMVSGTTPTLIILAAAPTPPTQRFALALENALVGVHEPRLFLVRGQIAAGAKQFDVATVTVLMDARWLVPTLPDPYAADFVSGPLIDREAIGLLGVVLTWAGGAASDVGLGIAVTPAPGASGATILPQGIYTLLDLSTRADLFGVRLDGADGVRAGGSGAGFVDLNLAIADAAVASFALPQVSWEPMLDTADGAPTVLAASPATDGVPTLIQAPSATQTLVPVAPEPVLLRTIGNVAAGSSFTAEFSLPFGLTASISQTNRPPIDQHPALFALEGGVFALTQPSFAAGSGALQLTLGAPNPTATDAKFEGSTLLSTVGNPPGYGAAVLGSSVAAIFAGDFSNNGGVPVLRADLAGYGASIWSEWVRPNPKRTDIIKVQFETATGRTAYEVIKAQTTLYPHGVRLVRTVTIARQNAGWVQRADSGWVAAKPGLYQFPNTGFPLSLVHPGAIAGVFNVRNVREFESVTVPEGTVSFTYVRALFDADVGLDHRVKVTQGGTVPDPPLLDAFGNPVTLVHARDLTGYVQVAPDESGSPPPANPDPGPADLAALFARVGPITDAFSCVVEIGGTGTVAGPALRCSGISFDMTTTPSPQLVAALLSSPVLPRDGAWGLGKRGSAATAPVPLPAGTPVPLVQPNSDPSTWHFADIADVLQLASPNNVYGLLQDTGTQKTLFEQPVVKDLTGAAAGAMPGIQLPAGIAPVLADVGSLLGATGLFPDISKTISFLTGGVEQLKQIPDGLAYSKQIPLPNDPTTLIDLTVVQIALQYSDTQGQTAQLDFNIDPAQTLPASNGRNWWLTIGPIAFTVTVPQFGNTPILTITGKFAADDRSKPGLTGLQIDYGAALSDIQSLFSKLQALASFLPGGAGVGLDVSLSSGQLTVRDTFAIPTLPLGLGNLSDISLDLGLSLTLSPLSADFLIGIGDPGNPFNWVVSPLAGNGSIDLGAKGGKPDFIIQGGIGLGLSIDVGIAEGSAAVTLAVSIEAGGNSLTVMVILNGQASVDVLDGLASASLALTASVGVGITPFPPRPTVTLTEVSFPSETITFLASVAVGIHLSICWVVSVDFEGAWSFSQSVSTPALTVDV
jgi:hypothetical protein